MEKMILNNPQLPPTTELLTTVLNDNYVNFNHLLEVFDKHNIVPEWRYYNDGKSWLCKVQHKNKTVLWLSVWEECFKLSFFFTEKTKGGVEDLEIDTTIKELFKQQVTTGRLIPLILEIKDSSVLPDAEKILQYKIKCK